MLQDEIMEVVYSICRGHEPILHGGTAIWRCYNGGRFSEDLDFYGAMEENFKGQLEGALSSRGLRLVKYKKAPHVVFAKVSNGFVEASLEISEGSPEKKELCSYEKTDGSSMGIYSLSKEELIKEKMKAYLGRRFIRDIYDVYFLGRQLGKVPGMQEFLGQLPPPADEKNLRTLIYEGIAPSFREIVEQLRRMA